MRPLSPLMLRSLRRALGLGPTVAERHRAALLALGSSMAAGLAEGVKDPRPLTPMETEHLLTYTGTVARRSFPALYDDEDGCA
ncbi:hypothetical protein ACOZDE_18520 [Streptomyces griseoincarnatus]